MLVLVNGKCTLSQMFNLVFSSNPIPRSFSQIFNSVGKDDWASLTNYNLIKFSNLSFNCDGDWVFNQDSEIAKQSRFNSCKICSNCSRLLQRLLMCRWPHKSPFGLCLWSQTVLAWLRVWKIFVERCLFKMGFPGFTFGWLKEANAGGTCSFWAGGASLVVCFDVTSKSGGIV